MRFCVLQSAYPTGHVLEAHDDYADPARFITQHVFEHRFIQKADAHAQIDAAVAEKFDFYLSLMWGQPEDEVAGVDATEYFESLNVPFIGLCSRILRKSKTDFYRAARLKGSPRVPADNPDSFPVIVKAASSCASQFLSSSSLCFTPQERDAAVDHINQLLQPGRLRRREGRANDSALTEAEPAHSSITTNELPEDIVVQEFVPGVDYSCVVIEFGTTPIALNPTIYNYPANAADDKHRFLTFDLKFHAELSESLIRQEDDPDLFERIQQAAVAAYEVNDMAGGLWGNVDVRVKPSGEIVVIEVNPMPAVFLSPEHQWEDPVISNSLPGGHRALLNIMLASYHMQTNKQVKTRLSAMQIEYDKMAPKYDDLIPIISSESKALAGLMSRFDFSGSILDVACGTGLFAEALRSHRALNSSGESSRAGGSPREIDDADNVSSKTQQRLVGVDLSPEMAKICRTREYETVHVGPMQEILPRISEPFDHIICYQSLNFVSTFDISLILSRCFQLAQRSVTLGVDEVPDAYNTAILAKNPPTNLMTCINHVPEVREYGTPLGWKLVHEDRFWGWVSPATGVEVYSTVFRYEKV